VALGTVLAEIGQFFEARRYFDTALRLEPANAVALFGIANIQRISSEDPVIPDLQRAVAEIASQTPPAQIQLHFAAAKVHSDLGQFTESFSHVKKGNALKRSMVDYDEPRAMQVFERLKRHFTPERLSQHGQYGHSTNAPIFILGMMRSGSTLVEQMLGSHPKVIATGERTEFQDAVHHVVGGSSVSRIGLSELLDRIAPAAYKDIGTEYLRRMRSFAVGSDRFTDKLPGNFLYAGLIHQVFPQALIIHTHRDPIETCLSCYNRLFADNQQPQTYDLGELGRFYRAYKDLMEHWTRVLPSSAILHVKYEDFVANTERQTRRILDFCGLEWSASCLEFHLTSRPVRTASLAQVRQPIYTTSIRRFRPSPAELRPLLEGLGLPCETLSE